MLVVVQTNVHNLISNFYYNYDHYYFTFFLLLPFQTIHYRRRICQAARSLNCVKEDEPMLTE